MGVLILVGVVGLAFHASSCVADGPHVASGGQVSISVAPLSLPSVTQAEYRLVVKNQAAETIFEREIDSRAFGPGDGSAS